MVRIYKIIEARVGTYTQKNSNGSSNKRYPATLITIKKADKSVRINVEYFKALKSLQSIILTPVKIFPEATSVEYLDKFHLEASYEPLWVEHPSPTRRELFPQGL